MKHAFVSLLLFIIGIAARAQSTSLAAPWPKHEVRAVWLTTIGGIDWPHSYANHGQGIERQQAELRQLLDLYQAAGINTILLQTRIRGTLLYPSELEPMDGCLSGTPGQSPGYDALQFAIDEAHRRGMELHAWVVTIPVGKTAAAGAKNLQRKHPELLKRIGVETYLNPEDTRTGDYLADICEEIVRRYDVDGIHLDYIRYPETWRRKVSADQGRRNITAIATAISQRVKAVKPWVKMSCSPIGKHDDLSRYWSHGWNARSKVCQDAQEWLRTGVMDQLYPMMYFRDNNFFPFVIDWQENQFGGTVAAGLGIYFLDPREGKWTLPDVTRELEVMRQIGVGQCFFRGKFLTDNTKGIYDWVCRHNRYPSLVPPLRVPDGVEPPMPQQPHAITMTLTGVRWQGEAPYYNVYSSYTWPVDTRDARNLVSTRRSAPWIACDTRGRYFAVTAMDRYGRESPALQSHDLSAREEPVKETAQLLHCDGTRLALPPQAHDLDAAMLIVETMQGSIVATRPYNEKAISVRGIQPGHYVLKSLGKKGVTHRLGFFQI